MDLSKIPIIKTNQKACESQKYLPYYKGYMGNIEYSLNDKIHYGQIAFIEDTITYEGFLLSELEDAFHKSVDNYLKFCERVGKIPDSSEYQD